MTEEKDIIELIKEKYSTFTRLEKVVGDYIMEKTDSVVFSSLKALAEEAGVSTTTVIRFGRSLGFQGYSEMREYIRKYVMYKKSLPGRLNDHIQASDEESLAAQVFEKDIYNIRETLKGLDRERLKRTVSLLCEAESICVFGLRGAFPLAYSMALTLGEVRRNVRLINGIGMAYPEEIAALGKGDACIVYAFQRYLRMVMDVVKGMREREVKIVFITGQSYKKIEDLADIVLPCFTDGYSFKASMVSPMVLSNYIITAMAMEDREEAGEMLSLTEEWLNRGLFLSE
ncbi:MAG TPA: MurR/RpiR family transcriptional regulator [Candidatus Copromorpha excrementigallinarum]|uniref:MurR/RpiR family transcriptional regulator n=1 Tax=Candidatus Allocopromorpha excrementigallinarum TaxID=2840742 RepID=A0A9D1L6L4_9FIRM|nr:MurR/RpiR family transcriptional regulator [Candidatus Copromorpha excrementigallinarum]